MVTQVVGSGLSSSATSLAQQGYVITATTTNDAGYTLWGFKPTGSTQTYTAMVTQVVGSGLSSSATSLAQQGYVITATTTNDAGYTLWGFKPTGSTQTYAAMVTQVVGSGLSSSATSLAQQWLRHHRGDHERRRLHALGLQAHRKHADVHAAMVTQVVGSGLSSSATSFAQQGYVITATDHEYRRVHVVGVQALTARLP